MGEKFSNGPFVELGALHKLLDRLKPDDSECTSAWYSSSEPCCKEIVHRFTNLLNEWASDDNKVEQCLATDPTLTKCQHCGVIKSVESSQVQDDVSSKKKIDDSATIGKIALTSESNGSGGPRLIRRNTLRQEIMRNSHPVLPNCLNVKRKNNVKKKIYGTGEPVIIDTFLKHRWNKSNGIEIDKYLGKNVDTLGNDGSQRSPDKSAPIEPTYFRKVANKSDKKIILPVDAIHDKNRDENCDAEFASDFNANDRSTSDKRKTKCDTFERSSASLSDSDSKTSAVGRSLQKNMIRQWMKTDCNVFHANVNAETFTGTKDLSVIDNVRGIIEARQNKFDSFETRFRVDKNIISKDRSNNSTVTQPCRDKVAARSDAPDPTATPDIESVAILNCHKVEGLSGAMTTATWDKKIMTGTIVSPPCRDRDEHVRPCENSERGADRIFNGKISFDNGSCDNAIMAAMSKVLLVYRNIIESKEQMDWSSFEHLVSGLHPSHGELWRDICRAVSNEAKRVAAETGAITEICIEINPITGNDETQHFRCPDDEISFELDIVLGDVDIIVEENDVVHSKPSLGL